MSALSAIRGGSNIGPLQLSKLADISSGTIIMDTNSNFCDIEVTESASTLSITEISQKTAQSPQATMYRFPYASKQKHIPVEPQSSSFQQTVLD